MKIIGITEIHYKTMKFIKIRLGGVMGRLGGV